DEGRFAAHPRRVLGALFPYDEDIGPEFVEEALQALARTGRLVLYSIAGERYAQLTKLAAHQRINSPSKSRIPPPPGGVTEHSVNAHGALSEPSRLEREVEGERGSGDGDSSSPPPPSRARTREAEGGHPDPDAAGPRQQAAAGSEQREVEPDRSA